MATSRRLLSVGHSYVVSLNRRLVNEMARLGAGQWDITAVAPQWFYGDLRSLQLTPCPDERCQVEGVPVYWSRWIHAMVYGPQLWEVLQRGWDVVHCWEEPYILAGGQVAAWLPTISPITGSVQPQPLATPPLVFSTFQNLAKTYPPPFNWIEQYAMGRASGWICFGQTSAATLQKRAGYDLPQRIIPVGVDVHHFAPSPDGRSRIRTNLGWNDDHPPVIGFLGRLVPEKGLPLLMTVLDQLQTPWRALFVGTGPLEPALRRWASRYPNQVRICTDVAHAAVPQYLNAMDLLCAPSQTYPNWREQFGRMLIEAFACGVPVLGSNSGEIPYVLADAGWVIEEQDEAGWLKAIAMLLESPNQRRELGARGLEKAHRTYRWDIVARHHLAFFEEFLSCKVTTSG